MRPEDGKEGNKNRTSTVKNSKEFAFVDKYVRLMPNTGYAVKSTLSPNLKLLRCDAVQISGGKCDRQMENLFPELNLGAIDSFKVLRQ